VFTLAVAAGLAAPAAVAAGLAALAALAAALPALAAVAGGLAAVAAVAAGLAAIAALAAALAALAAVSAGLAALAAVRAAPPPRANPHSPGLPLRGVPPCGGAPLLNLAVRQRPVREHEDTGWPRADTTRTRTPASAVSSGESTPRRGRRLPSRRPPPSWCCPARTPRC